MAIFTENTGPNVWDWGGSPRRHPQWQYIATHRAHWTAWWMIELWAVQRKSWSLIEKESAPHKKIKVLPSIVLELMFPKAWHMPTQVQRRSKYAPTCCVYSKTWCFCIFTKYKIVTFYTECVHSLYLVY